MGDLFHVTGLSMILKKNKYWFIMAKTGYNNTVVEKYVILNETNFSIWSSFISNKKVDSIIICILMGFFKRSNNYSWTLSTYYSTLLKP